MALTEEALEVLRQLPVPGQRARAGEPHGTLRGPERRRRPSAWTCSRTTCWPTGRPGGPGPRAWRSPPDGFDLEAYLAALKGHFMRQALERAEGNKTRAARLLGMSFRAYRYWLQEMGGAGHAPGPASPGPRISRPPEPPRRN